ncbi:hypothetical protein [Micromonospora sp. WMMD737]|uniref:hypothetical protein n=1 Tax=Micromonospora sp. WMMD737 TaxID=3404113 RepID=UPI003B9383CE
MNSPRPATPSVHGVPLPAAGLDEFQHTPARLNVCALLAPAEWVLFSFLRDSIGTSDSNAYLASREDLVARARGTAESARQRPAGGDRLADDGGRPLPVDDRLSESGQPTRDGVFSSPN